jgi:Iron only nitrogenase protein AnfO (AnfO_nitrog).
MKIAIFVDEYGTVLPFYSLGVVEIYSDENDAWKCIKQLPMDMSSRLTMNEILLNIRKMVVEFEDCNLLVIEKVQGIVRSYLSDFQIGTWNVKGLFLGEDMLNHIRQKVETAILEQQQKQAVPVPLQIEGDAVYKLDLTALSDCDVSLNSRNVLIPFFQDTDFRKLLIVSKQNLNWLEQSLVLLQLSLVSDDLSDGIICLTVTPNDFETGLGVRKEAQIEKSNSQENECVSLGCGSAGSCITEMIKSQQNKEKMPA